MDSRCICCRQVSKQKLCDWTIKHTQLTKEEISNTEGRMDLDLLLRKRLSKRIRIVGSLSMTL